MIGREIENKERKGEKKVLVFTPKKRKKIPEITQEKYNYTEKDKKCVYKKINEKNGVDHAYAR